MSRNIFLQRTVLNISSLLAYWPCDDPQFTYNNPYRAQDVSGNGRHATLSGVIQQKTGSRVKGFSFPTGATMSVASATWNKLENYSAWSLMAFVNLNSLTGYSSRLFQKNNKFWLAIDRDGADYPNKLTFAVIGTGSNLDSSSVSNMSTNTDYLIIAVFDNGTPTVYLNGFPLAMTINQSFSAPQASTASADFEIGCDTVVGDGEATTNCLAHCAVWNKALSRQEARQLAIAAGFLNEGVA